MKSLTELIKESFDIWCKVRWLRYIDKEIKLHDKYQKKSVRYKSEAQRHFDIAQRLHERFCELFPKQK